MRYAYIGSNDGYPIEEDSIVCERCGDICTGNFRLFEWPGEFLNCCVCKECNQELIERYQEQAELLREEMKDLF